MNAYILKYQYYFYDKIAIKRQFQEAFAVGDFCPTTKVLRWFRFRGEIVVVSLYSLYKGCIGVQLWTTTFSTDKNP